MAYCIHTLLLKDALSIFTVLVEQNYTFTLRKSEENLYSFYVTLLASWTHILLLKDALSIFTLLVEQEFTFTLRKSEENLSRLLENTIIIDKGCPLYIYCIGRKKLFFHFEEIWRESLYFLCYTLGFFYTHIIGKGCPLFIYSMGRKKTILSLLGNLKRISLLSLLHCWLLVYTYC